jgi:hypothetical protein
MRRFLVAVPVALALSGCPASVNGQVDGQGVPSLFSAFFLERERDIGTETLTSVNGVGVSLFDGCNAAAKRQFAFNVIEEDFFDAIDGETNPDKLEDARVERAEAIAAYDQQNLPSDYWTVGINVSSLNKRKIDGGDSEIDLERPDVDQTILSSVSVCRINDHPQERRGELRVDQDCWVGKVGDVEVLKWESEKSFHARADVDLAEQEDIEEEVGTVIIEVNAGYCQPLQDALDELEDIFEDFFGR